MSADEVDESPLAGRAAESGLAEEGDVDDAPDWLSFAAFAKGLSKQKGGSATISGDPVIPKRGEKDFEPAHEERYVNLQTSLLGASRSALFTAVSSGVRSHSSKVHNRAIWDKELGKAYMVSVKDPAQPPVAVNTDANNPMAHGVHFLTMGRYEPQRKRLELLPEETLYLLERGTIECWTGVGEEAVPMTVQHAWSQMISANGLSAERYHVYAWLRRLGYTVIRADYPQSGRRPRPADISRTMTLAYTTIERLGAILSSPRELLRLLHRPLIPPSLANAAARLHSILNSRTRSLVGGLHWFSYDHVFSTLQFVKRQKRTQTKRTERPYDVFFHVYKPVTKFKKTEPPEPDFRIGVINAEYVAVPDLFDFERIFSELPDEPVAVGQRNPSSLAKQSTGGSFIERLKRIFGYNSNTGTSKSKSSSLTRPPPYAKLKNGRKSAIIAVVDNGLISFLRFGDTDFSELPWVGGKL